MTIAPDYATPFNPRSISSEHIADRCVCCGHTDLRSSPAILMPFVAHRALGRSPVVIDESWGLKTIPHGTAHSICASLYCPACHFLFLDLRFSEREMGNLYRDYRGREYNALRERYEPGYTARNDELNAGIDYIDQIERFLDRWLTFPVNILDRGGDTGKNTPFKNRHADFHIYYISAKPVIEGARRIDKDQVIGGGYGLLVCSNVLEHVPYPCDLVLDIKQAMNDASVLYIEVPLEEVVRTNDTDLHLEKRHWHEHINFFSEQSLKRLIENCGLEILAHDTLHSETGDRSVYLLQIACRLNPSV
jgi:hypothetical protein